MKPQAGWVLALSLCTDLQAAMSEWSKALKGTFDLIQNRGFFRDVFHTT